MKFFVLLILMILTGCVIEDPNKVDKSLIKIQDPEFSFEGIESAIAISHKGFQVSFAPAVGGSGQFDYNLYVDGNFGQSVASVASENAGVDSHGKLNVFVNNLTFRSIPYSLVVRASDRVALVEDRNTVAIVLPVLGYETPLFNGAIKLENVQGALGKSALSVSWSLAEPSRQKTDDIFGPPNPYDISGYVIYYQKAGDVTPNSAFLASASSTSYTITGLDESSFYTVWVQAKDSQTPGVQDGNLVKFTKSTKPESEIKFSGIATASAPANYTGLYSLQATWPSASGDFSKYRIFFTEDNTSATNEIVNPASPSTLFSYVDVSISAENTNVTSHQFVAGLPGKLFKVFVVACDASCANFDTESTTTFLTASTTPPVAPFFGGTTIVFGIDTAEINWLPSASPDEGQGAYDGYRVTQRVCSTPLLCVERILTNTAGSGPGETQVLTVNPTKLSKKVNITGLTTNTSYCFKVESSLSAGGPPTRVHELGYSPLLCGIPQYQMAPPPEIIPEDYLGPGNQQMSRNCRDPMTDGFTVRWKGPVTGTYNQFEVFVQELTTLQPSIDWNANPTTVVPFNVSSAYYVEQVANKIAGTTIGVGIRAVYDNGTKYYGQKTFISCLIEIQKVVPQGWLSIMAIGLKNDALLGESVPESFALRDDVMADPTTIDNGGAPYRISSRGHVNEMLASSAFPFEFPLLSKNYNQGSLLPAAGRSNVLGGMARFTWKDFQFEDGSNFSQGASAGTVGYNVYRRPYLDLHGTTPPLATDSGWGTPLNPVLIKANIVNMAPKPNFSQAEFIDYTIPAAGSATDAKVYWYKVEPYIGTTKVNLVAVPGDYILKIVVPPQDMAMAHHWMLNKEACERINKPYDRDHQYRCSYNGVGSRRFPLGASSGPLYLDFSGHLLIDRFELGCNFTNAVSACLKTNLDPATEVNKVFSCFGEPGCSTATHGIKAGACVGINTREINIGVGADGAIPTLVTNTTDGTVWYNRGSRKRNGSYDLPADSCFLRTGGVWKSIEEAIDNTETTPLVQANVISTAVSNKAGLPPLTMVSQENFSKICGNFSVDLKSSTSTLRAYKKRLPRKDEYVALMADPIEATNYSDHYEGSVSSRYNMGCNTKHGYNYAQGSRVNPTTLFAYEKNHAKANSGVFGQGINQLNLHHFRYPKTTITESSGFEYAATGPVFASGSQGYDSTAACTFRYGIQDIMGNVPEFAGDVFRCITASECYPIQYSQDTSIIQESHTMAGDPNKVLNFTMDLGVNRIGYPHYDISLVGSYAGYGTNYAAPKNPVIYSYSEWYNVYLNPGVYPGYQKNIFTTAPYFSKFAGLPLNCQGADCVGGEDSMAYSLAATTVGWQPNPIGPNLLLSAIGNDKAKSEIAIPPTDMTTHGNGNSNWLMNKRIGYVVGGFPCNSQNLSANYGSYANHKHNQACDSNDLAQGRYSYTMTVSELKYPDVTGRCSVKIEEDENGKFQ